MNYARLLEISSQTLKGMQHCWSLPEPSYVTAMVGKSGKGYITFQMRTHEDVYRWGQRYSQEVTDTQQTGTDGKMRRYTGIVDDHDTYQVTIDHTSYDGG